MKDMMIVGIDSIYSPQRMKGTLWIDRSYERERGIAV